MQAGPRSEAGASECTHRCVAAGLQLQAIDERRSEGRRLDLPALAGLDPDAVGEAERRGAEEMHVHIARPAEQRVLEVMVLEVRDRVRHVRLAAEKRLLPAARRTWRTRSRTSSTITSRDRKSTRLKSSHDWS